MNKDEIAKLRAEWPRHGEHGSGVVNELLDHIERLDATFVAEAKVHAEMDIELAETIAGSRGWLSPNETEDTLRARAEKAERERDVTARELVEAREEIRRYELIVERSR